MPSREPHKPKGLNMKIFYLSDDAKAANPGVPTVFEKRFRAVIRRGGKSLYSIHATREEAERSAKCCQAKGLGGRVIETLEELFVLPPEPANGQQGNAGA
jgi:hypothetical protein